MWDPARVLSRGRPRYGNGWDNGEQRQDEPAGERRVTDLPILVIKALNGGLFVVAFALVGEMLQPKRFAGLFSAAPSVALANLIVVIASKGPGVGSANARGMLVGAAAFAVSAAGGVLLVRRYRAKLGAALVAVTWLGLAGAGYRVFLA